MTAAAIPARAWASPASPRAAARLVRLELRRSPVPWVLPLVAAVFWFDCWRIAMTLPVLWTTRTFYVLGQGHAIIDFGPFVAGAAAWAGSREGRRRMSDLVAVTAVPRWAARLAGLVASVSWAVAGYAACVGALFAVIARQAAGGSPPWWAAVVGAAGVAALTAAGFAAGSCFPGRLCAPLTAFGTFVALGISSQLGFQASNAYSLVLPTRSQGQFAFDSGVFYPYLPDVPIARLLLLGGLAVAAAGVLGLPRGSGGQLLRRGAAAVAAAGLLAAGTGVCLAGTARLTSRGADIPALHDAASDRAIPYTPACRPAAGTPVCVHPAYRPYLPDVTAALSPLLREVAGLPGAPVRVTQVPGRYTGIPQPGTVAGQPATLRLDLADLGLPGIFGVDTRGFIPGLRLVAAAAFVAAPGTPGATPPQQAVAAAVAARAGLPLPAQQQLAINAGLPSWPAPGPGPGARAYAAARSLAAMPAPAFRAWLTTHLPALRSGTLTLADLP